MLFELGNQYKRRKKGDKSPIKIVKSECVIVWLRLVYVNKEHLYITPLDFVHKLNISGKSPIIIRNGYILS